MVGGGHSKGHAWQGAGGVHGRGVYVAGGVHGRGHVWQGACVVGGGVCMVGACMAGGMCGGGWGCAWQGACMVGGEGVCMAGWGHVWWGSMCGRGACMAGACVAGACVAGKTAIAAGGSHPTGMHSCFHAVFNKLLPNYRSSPPLGLAPPGNPGSAAGELIVLASGGGTTQKLVMNTN